MEIGESRNIRNLKRYIRAHVLWKTLYQETIHQGRACIRVGRRKDHYYKEGPIIRIYAPSPREKDLMGRLRLIWENRVKEDVQKEYINV